MKNEKPLRNEAAHEIIDLVIELFKKLKPELELSRDVFCDAMDDEMESDDPVLCIEDYSTILRVIPVTGGWVVDEISFLPPEVSQRDGKFHGFFGGSNLIPLFECLKNAVIEITE